LKVELAALSVFKAQLYAMESTGIRRERAQRGKENYRIPAGGSGDAESEMTGANLPSLPKPTIRYCFVTRFSSIFQRKVL
jgi:hypothetical protein